MQQLYFIVMIINNDSNSNNIVTCTTSKMAKFYGNILWQHPSFERDNIVVSSVFFLRHASFLLPQWFHASLTFLFKLPFCDVYIHVGKAEKMDCWGILIEWSLLKLQLNTWLCAVRVCFFLLNKNTRHKQNVARYTY